MKSNTMNAHENTHAEPPRECPNSLKALVYFNFVLLFFVGIMFFGDLKNVDDLDEIGFLGLLYASEEELTGHDPNDPNDYPTQKEVDAALEAEQQ